MPKALLIPEVAQIGREPHEDASPEVCCWGEQGIDALIRPKPYMVPSSEPLVEAERDVRLRVLAGGA